MQRYVCYCNNIITIYDIQILFAILSNSLKLFLGQPLKKSIIMLVLLMF